MENLFAPAPFSLPQAEKAARLLPLLRELTAHHHAACPAYRRIADLTAPDFAHAQTAADIPFVPAALFKFRDFRSVPDSEVRVAVRSSGTGGEPSRVALDADGAKRASKALACIMGEIARERLPMLIVDSPSAITGRDGVNARAAAILGLMPFGRDHVFALGSDLQPDISAISLFLEKHAGKDILIFGFTFLVWQALRPACEKHGFDLSRATLLHSGGWKKLQHLAVDNDAFKAGLRQAAGVKTVRNFYGMAETPGVIFLEGDDGLLYPPHFADVVIRDPVTLRPLPRGEAGLIEIVSALPRSYPGHALLTEDIGVVEKIDGALMGQGLRVIGRAPQAELRGCSDVMIA